MNKEKFIYLLNNSQKITLGGKPDSIYYVYNKSIERQVKYNRLFNRNKPINYFFNKKDILFVQDLKNMHLWYDYDYIYQKLKENYKDLDISNLIDGWLKDDTNWKLYSSTGWKQPQGGLENWKLYSTDFASPIPTLYDTNWKLYTHE
jgi:hypothetical protein